MQVGQEGWVEDTARFARKPRDPSAEVDKLREARRRQAHVIETMSEAMTLLHSGAAALKAENAELRADNEQLRDRLPAGARGDEEPAEFRFTIDARAPAAARGAVSGALRGRVSADVLERAQLVVSELATNSVVHSGASAGEELVLRVHVTGSAARLEVQDPGRGRHVAPRVGDARGGFGLNL